MSAWWIVSRGPVGSAFGKPPDCNEPDIKEKVFFGCTNAARVVQIGTSATLGVHAAKGIIWPQSC
jgi:hypothetical protein